MKKDINYYMSLPYRIEIQKNSDGSFFGMIPELKGCMSEADTVPELMEMLEDAKRGWLDITLEDGMDIPEPEEKKEYSGHFITRIPKTLHKNLAVAAKKENISLNQYIAYLLSKNFHLTVNIKKKGGMLKKIK